MQAITPYRDGVLIALQVMPRASRTEIAGSAEGVIRLRVSAPPVDGAANKEIIAWLAKQLKVPKSAISVVRGERGRLKSVYVPGIRVDDALSALGQL